MTLSRRDFLATGAAAAAGLALPDASAASGPPPARALARPVIVGSSNGYDVDQNGKRGIQVAWDLLNGGGDPLDAVIAGVNIVELNPNDQSVGLGGLPNEEGVVQLDASCMHGPTRRAGSVAALEGIATPSLVAKAVMDYTDHVMLVGPGAKKFALAMGFREQDLLTPKSRQDWLRWRAKQNATDNWLDHDDDVRINWTHGTINMNAVTAGGDIGSVTTTSGRSWKLDGRVGDSPIIGAGQYCDNDVGAAGSTGRGEANIMSCGAFLAVEEMRRGADPQTALLRVVERVIKMTEKRLLDERGRPYFDLEFYAVSKDGRYAGASLYEGSTFAVADARGARVEKSAFLYRASERPKGAAPGFCCGKPR